MADPLDEAYPQSVMAIMRETGWVDFGGVCDDDLFAYYEQVTGKKFEWRETNPGLPKYAGLKRLGIFFRQSERRARRDRRGWANLRPNVRAKARAHKGATEEEARAIGARYLCPACGPVTREPFHGDDEHMHCPELDCDEVVSAVLPESEEIDWRAQGRKTWKEREDRMKEPKKCAGCREKFTPPPGSGNYKFCKACKKARASGKPTKPKPAKKDPKFEIATVAQQVHEVAVSHVDQTTLKQEAEALVRVADAIDGLDKKQISRVLAFVESVL